jgi:hypothetical protein
VSWLELDDGILDHPKFIRAVKLGGDSAVFLWLGLRSYCGKQLTDGFVPTDMLDEVRGPKDPKKRAAALAALIEVRLLEQADDGVQMHDYLQWSRSRAEVLESRRKNSEPQARSRGSHAVTDTVTTRSVTPSVTTPSPSPSPSPSPLPTPIPEESKSASARPDEQATWDGSERETLCPLDLSTRAATLKIPEQLAESLKVDVGAVAESIREFVGYWTIGAGMGQKRRHWMRKLREHVRKAAGRPGGLAAPGALEHQQRGGRLREASPNIDHEAKKALQASKRYAEFVGGAK